MQCNRCGATLPTGASTCPSCANPTPYNVGSSSAAPTVYGQPPQAPYEPTVYAPPPQVPHEQPAYTPPPQAPYPPPAYVPPPQAPYPPPAYMPPPQMPYAPPIMVPVVVQPRKSGCGVATIILLVVLLVLVCGASLIVGGVYISSKQNASATVTSMNDDATSTAYSTALTPTPYPPYSESNSPSGANFSEAAQQVIPSAQLASAVDSSQRPTELQSTFQSDQTIYLVYKWAQGNTGYVQTRWYYDGELKDTSMSKYITQYAVGYGYMTDSFFADGNTGQGTIEVFWCQDSACTHGGLSWVRPFSVTTS